MNIDFTNKKLVQGSSNTVLIEDLIEGSNGTALVFRVNDFIDAVEDELNKLNAGGNSYVSTSGPTFIAPTTASIIGVGLRTGSVSITLPKADQVPAGKIYTIVDESSEALTKPISVSMPPAIGLTITASINTNGAHIKVYSNSTNWIQI